MKPPHLSRIAELSTLLLLLAALAVALNTGCAATTHLYPSAPRIAVRWAGTAEQPWTDVESAIVAGKDALGLDGYELQIYGTGDLMNASSTPNWTTGRDGEPRLTIGSTEFHECGAMGLGCRDVVRIRQIRGPEHQLLDVDLSALWDELGCRLWPFRTKGTLGGYGAECDAARARLRARYYELRDKRHAR